MRIHVGVQTALLALLVLLGSAIVTTSALQAKRYQSIREVDFRNFTYSAGLGDDPQKITVHDGECSVTEPEEDRLYFAIVDVVYGDVTGDGIEDAIVQTIMNTGGTGQFSDGSIFILKNGKPEEIASLGIGDRADGGIHSIKIADGKIMVDRYGQDNGGACCPEYVESTTIKMTGGKFSEVGRPTRRAYVVFDGDENARPTSIRFLKGTSGATLSGSTNAGERFSLGVQAGQTISLDFDTKDPKATVVVSTPERKSLLTLTGRSAGNATLPTSGTYVISISSKQSKDEYFYYSLDLSVK